MRRLGGSSCKTCYGRHKHHDKADTRRYRAQQEKIKGLLQSPTARVMIEGKLWISFHTSKSKVLSKIIIDRGHVTLGDDPTIINPTTIKNISMLGAMANITPLDTPE